MDKKDRIIKMSKIYIKNLTSKNISLLANNLTYVMLLTIFPFLAIVLGISKGFGLDEKILSKIREIVSKDEIIINYILHIINNLIESAKGGLLTGFGIIILILSVIFMLDLLETTFNDIWNVKKERQFISKIISYIAIIFISPVFILLIMASSSLIVELVYNSFGIISSNAFIIIKIINLILTLIFIVILFLILPNRRVKLKPALIGAIITVIGLYILAYIYNLLQGTLNQYNVIYGSIAFIPIFLIWIKYAWTIILIGSQITYTIQTSNEILEDKIKLTPSLNKKMGIYIFKIMVDRFNNNEGSYSLDLLCEDSGISKNILLKVLQNLDNLDLVNEITDENREELYFQINKNPNITSIKYLYDIIDEEDKDFEYEIVNNFNENQKKRYFDIREKIEMKNNQMINFN